MKKLLTLVVLCGLAPAAQAVDIAGTEIGITVDATFMSKYIWRGFDKFDDKAAWQPSVDFDLGNGFGANIWASYPGGAGNSQLVGSRVDATEFDYTLYYGNSVMDDCFKTDYTVGWRYYDFIDRPSKANINTGSAGDAQELFLEFAMPQLIGNGFVPRGAIYHMWKARSGGGVSFPTGEIYVMGLDYNWTFQQAPELPMTLSWDIVYNDGVGSSSVDHDWSHMLWGLKTNFKCPATGGKITPAVYFQNSFEKTVNTQDELFAGISYSLSF